MTDNQTTRWEWRVAVKSGAVAAVTVALLFLSWCVAFSYGQADVRRSTVVRLGSPYYHGNYYGKCAWIGRPGETQACATDGRTDEYGRPI